MSEQGVAIRQDRELALQELEIRFQMAARQRELLERYIRERLKPDKHFYTVGDDESPNRKPSLTKEGAELICLPHALKPAYEILSGPQSPPLDDAPYQLTVRCELRKGDAFEGQGIGSASSMVTKRSGERVQRQKDPGLRHNATLKMACKSAYIAATLNATAASEFFTQDLEDDEASTAVTTHAEDKHWCSVHKTAFFKKGKMQHYAHPIEGGGWCNEDKQPKAEIIPELPKAEVTPPDSGDTPPENGGPAKNLPSPEIKTLGDLFTKANKELHLSQSQVLAKLGIASKDLIGDLSEAWQKLTGQTA